MNNKFKELSDDFPQNSFYDALPRFTESNQTDDDSNTNTPVRSFLWRGEEYRLKINPGQVMGNDGAYRHNLPGTIEREIELIIRNSAHNLLEGDVIGLALSQLRADLKEQFSLEEIITALDTLTVTAYKIIKGLDFYTFFIIKAFRRKTLEGDVFFLVKPDPLVLGRIQSLAELFED